MTGKTKAAARPTGILVCFLLAGALAAPPAQAGAGGVVGVAHHGHGGGGVVQVGYHYRSHHYRHHHYRPHHFRHGHYHHHHGHGAGRTLLGIGIGLLAYDIIHKSKAHARARTTYEESSYPPAYPPRRSAVRIEPPAASAGDCLQIREYQTIITVGGEEREAYGDACLMPDGNWRLGPPKLVPAY